jgi:hypothetical protein
MHRLTAALDARTTPLTLFFRDDDAGWGMDALDAMLAVFERNHVPVDLAVIPAVLTVEGANHLNDWQQRHPGIRLHQHGYAHANHEPEGRRKCEFGPSRPVERQCADILMGRERLSAMLTALDPIFTPPWNRCEPETVLRLTKLGFAAYSSDHAPDLTYGAPAMLPIHLDWEREWREEALIADLAGLVASTTGPLGIMLHHAVMTEAALAKLDAVLAQLAPHPNARCVEMRHLLEKPS